MRNARLCTQEWPLRIHRHHPIPSLFGEIVYQAQRDDSRVVDEDIYSAKCGDRFFSHPRAIVRGRDIGKNRNRLNAAASYLRYGFIKIGLGGETVGQHRITGLAEIYQSEIHALVRQLKRDPTADAACRPSHDGVLALKQHRKTVPKRIISTKGW